MRTLKPRQFAVLLPLFLLACGGGAAQPGTAGGAAGSGSSVAIEPGSNVAVTPAPVEDPDELIAALAKLDDLSAEGVTERYPTSFQAAPSYDLANVQGLEKIQASSQKLGDAELTQLKTQGFTISDNHAFPGFAYGYNTFYLEHLPLYVSADSILDAVHQSFEDILQTVEQNALLPELDALLSGMQDKLAAGAASGSSDAVVADADVYVTVARSLLLSKLQKPSAGGSAADIKTLFELAQAGQGTRDVSLFGTVRTNEDFSQFEPRGHYQNSEQLSRYFRAMMWLGRIDLRILETQPDGQQLFRRRQLEAALLLHDLVGKEGRAHFDSLDRAIGAFVGESDYMTLPQADSFMSDLSLDDAAGLARYSDEQLAQAIIDGGYGVQRISSHIMVAGPHQGALPLSRSFALLGQRYVVDSHVFSNVVYDRVNSSPQRLLPNPLDVAFAALGNDQAAALLGDELAQYPGYPAALGQMRVTVDAHPEEYWTGSLYTGWLGALRLLSPAATSSAESANTLFPVARSEAWGRRLLNTQLSSWAQLRHDTILYAKQSYTGGNACEYPDAYVDPYPEFFHALSAYAARGAELTASLSFPAGQSELSTRIQSYFESSQAATEQLAAIAEHQRSGADLTPEMLTFINDAVVIQSICGGPGSVEDGWYKQLFFEPRMAGTSYPKVADVHTQPTDEAGAPVGRVLHVGNGTPRLMVVIADSCGGPRAYAGLATSYREKITENFERLNDKTWEGSWFQEPETPWMKPLVVGKVTSANEAL